MRQLLCQRARDSNSYKSQNHKPLDEHEQKETEWVTKLVEKAQEEDPPCGNRLRDPAWSIYRTHPTIVFDFVGRKNVQYAWNGRYASKKCSNTWSGLIKLIEVAHLEGCSSNRLVGGILVMVQKGRAFRSP